MVYTNFQMLLEAEKYAEAYAYTSKEFQMRIGFLPFTRIFSEFRGAKFQESDRISTLVRWGYCGVEVQELPYSGGRGFIFVNDKGVWKLDEIYNIGD